MRLEASHPTQGSTQMIRFFILKDLAEFLCVEPVDYTAVTDLVNPCRFPLPTPP